MKIDSLRLFDEKILRQKAEKIEKVDDTIVALAEQMIQTMTKHKGVGLAGNQVGVRKRIIVIDLKPCGYNGEPFAVINPEIVEASGSCVDDEGCLSFPELFLQVERPDKIKLVAQNLNGEKVEIYSSGLLARVLCHEIDHLEGVLLVDHVTGEQLEIATEFMKNYRTRKTEKSTKQEKA